MNKAAGSSRNPVWEFLLAALAGAGAVVLGPAIIVFAVLRRWTMSAGLLVGAGLIFAALALIGGTTIEMTPAG